MTCYYEKEWTTKAGLKAKVLVNDVTNYNKQAFRCGYINIPFIFIDEETGQASIDGDVDVYGGFQLTLEITDNSFPRKMSDQWIAFNCNHEYDKDYPKDLAYCVSECEETARQLADLAILKYFNQERNKWKKDFILRMGGE